MSEKTTKQQADELLSSLIKGREVHDIFAENFRKSLKISGEPIEEWEGKFKLSIPTDNLTPSMCKELGMKIMDLHQEATFFHAVALAKSQMIKRGSESSYNSKFWAIYQEHKNAKKKIPAAATLDSLAKIDNEDIESAQSMADIEVKFWKNILDHLSTCRKIIENASLNISVELKAIHSEKFMDRLNTNIGGQR
jgi:hypothetical protein